MGCRERVRVGAQRSSAAQVCGTATPLAAHGGGGIVADCDAGVLFRQPLFRDAKVSGRKLLTMDATAFAALGMSQRDAQRMVTAVEMLKELADESDDDEEGMSHVCADG